jgi:hypothetical protein
MLTVRYSQSRTSDERMREEQTDYIYIYIYIYMCIFIYIFIAIEAASGSGSGLWRPWRRRSKAVPGPSTCRCQRKNQQHCDHFGSQSVYLNPKLLSKMRCEGFCIGIYDC